MSLTVGGQLNFFRKFRDVNFEALLDIVEHLGVSLVRDKRDGETLGTESAGTCNLLVTTNIHYQIFDIHDEYEFHIVHGKMSLGKLGWD